MGNLIIIAGAFLVLIGIIINVLQKFGITKLPGDILIQKENFTFFFPIVTCIVLSIIVTVILNIFFRK